MTYIFVVHPSSAPYTITPDASSVALTGLRVADGRSDPQVTGTVSGSGQSHELHYHVGPMAGQSVTFVEQGREVDHVIGAATGASGTLAFTSGDGPAGSRQIVALVSQNGVPRAHITVASYDAVAPPVLGSPPNLAVAHRGCALDVTWGPVADSARYTVTTRTADGRDQVQFVQSRSGAPRAASVAGVCGQAAEVLVSAWRFDGNHGKPAVVRTSTVGTPHKSGSRFPGWSWTVVLVAALAAGAVVVVLQRRRVVVV